MTRVPTTTPSARFVPGDLPEARFTPDTFQTGNTPTGLSQFIPEEAPVSGGQGTPLSPKEVLDLMQTDPERVKKAFAAVKSRREKTFAERVHEFSGPVGRGAVGGAQDVGNFVVGSVMRGLSYLPGLEGLSDLANHNQRLASIQRAYDQHLNETGSFAKIATPVGAQFTSDVSQTLSQMLLLGGTGRGAGMNSSRRMTGWMAANYGAMSAERSLQVAADAGLEGASKNAYAAGMGGLEAGLTVAFGMAGEKLGIATAEEAISRGANRAVARVMDRSGLRKELVSMAAEGAEEEAIALSQTVFGTAMGVDSFDSYRENVGRAFLTGAAVRGVIGSGTRFAEKYNKALEDMPGAVEGTLDAQRQADGEFIPDEEVNRKIAELSGYEDAFNAELEFLGEVESSFAGSIKRKRSEADKKRSELDSRIDSLSQHESELRELQKALIASVGKPEGALKEDQERLSSDLKRISSFIDEELDLVAKEGKALDQEIRDIRVEESSAGKIIDSELARIAEAQSRLNSELEKLSKEVSGPGRPVDEADIGRASIVEEKKSAAREVENVTSARRDILQRDLKSFGLEAIPETERRAVIDSLETARPQGIPVKALQLSGESLASGNVWDSVTHIGVVDGLRVLKEVHSKVRKQVLETPGGSPDIDTLLAQEADLTNQMNTVIRALAANSTDQARALVSNRFAFSDPDSGMALFRARRSKGSDLSSDEIDDINRSAAEIKRLEKELLGLDSKSEAFRDKRRELHKAQMKFEDAQKSPAATGLVAAAGKANFLWHTLFTGLDGSFVGIHSALPLLTDPVNTAKAIFGGLKQSWTQDQETDAFLDLMDRPNGDLYKRGYVTIMAADSNLNTREDLVSQNFAKSWGSFDALRGFVNFWPRVFRTVVNRVRADTFDSIVASHGGRGTLTDAQLKDIGGWVDVITMRGGRGYLDKHTAAMNLILFAPRYYAAQIELLTGRPLRLADPESKKLIRKEYGRLLTRFGAIAGAAMLANLFAQSAGEDDVADINWTPNDSKFMQIRFGDTWVDPTLRLGRWIAFASQFGTAAAGIATNDEDLGDEQGRRVGTFVTGKFSLPLSSAVSLGTKRDVFGREVTRGDFLKDRFAPISVQQMRESISSYGVPKGTAVGLVQALGAPVQQDFARQQRNPLP